MRKGLGIGKGRGYYNLAIKDPYIHSLSAKGVKTYRARTIREPLLMDVPYLSKKMRFHAKGDKEIADHLTRKQAIDFLVHCGYDKKKLNRMSDDSLLTAYDIAMRKEKEFSDRCPNCGGTHEDTFGVCPLAMEKRSYVDEEYSGEGDEDDPHNRYDMDAKFEIMTRKGKGWKEYTTVKARDRKGALKKVRKQEAYRKKLKREGKARCFFCNRPKKIIDAGYMDIIDMPDSKIKGKLRYLPMDKRETGDNDFGDTPVCFKCVSKEYGRL